MSPFAPLTWNAERRRNADRTRTTRVHGRWNNTLDGDEWKAIDLGWQASAQDFRPALAPFGLVVPKRLKNGIQIEDRRPFDPVTKQKRPDAPVSMMKSFAGTADVNGEETPDGILYPGAYSFGDILVQTNQQEVRTLVVFPQEPAGTEDIEIPFTIELPAGISVLMREASGYRERSLSTEKDVGLGLKFAQDSFRSLVMKDAAVWGADGKRVPIAIRGKLSGNLFTGKKIVPRSVLSQLSYPAYCDTVTSITSEAGDGYVSYGNGTWTTCRGAATGDGSATNEAASLVGAFFIGGTTYACFRQFFIFAASIDAGEVISDLSLDLYFPNSAAAQDHSYYCVPGTQSTTLTTADYDALGSSGIGTGDPYSSAVTRLAAAAAGTKTFSLSAAAIAAFDKGGNNKYAVIDVGDWDNSIPTAKTDSGTGNNANMSDAASNDPTLNVTHAAPASSGNLLLLGVG